MTIVCAFSAWYWSSPVMTGVAGVGGAAGAAGVAGAAGAGAEVAGDGAAEDERAEDEAEGAVRCSPRVTLGSRFIAAAAVVAVDGVRWPPETGSHPTAARVPQQKIASPRRLTTVGRWAWKREPGWGGRNAVAAARRRRYGRRREVSKVRFPSGGWAASGG